MKLKKIDIPQVLQEDQGHLNDPNTTQFVSGQTIKLVIHPFAWFDPRNIGDHSITSEQQTSRVSRKKHVRQHKNYHVQRTQRAKKKQGQNSCSTSPSAKKNTPKHSSSTWVLLVGLSLVSPVRCWLDVWTSQRWHQSSWLQQQWHTGHLLGDTRHRPRGPNVAGVKAIWGGWKLDVQIKHRKHNIGKLHLNNE